MYAIIEDSGTQIKVAPGDTINVATRDLDDESVSLTFDRVLYVGGAEDAEPRIGQPMLEGVTVEADILEEGRTDKVDVVKFKRRKGYHRKRGHRQDYVSVRVTAING